MDSDNDMQQTTHELSQMNIELQNKKLSRPHPLSKQPSRASSLDTRTSTPVADINGLGWPGMLIDLLRLSFSYLYQQKLLSNDSKSLQNRRKLEQQN